jgi:hypothetical protein
MAIDTTTADGVMREKRNASLNIIKRKLEQAQGELEWLINATPSSERRNTLTEVNIHTSGALALARQLKSEES